MISHGQLGARLADGLGGDDADGLALADRLADGEVHAVAAGAHAVAGAAGQDGADLQAVDAVGLEQLGVLRLHHVVAGDQQLAGGGIDDVLDGIAALQALGEGLDDLAVLTDLADGDALGGAAVVLADDDILRNIDQTARQISRVCRTQRGVGQTFTCAMRGREVLQNRQTLTEVRLDGNLDVFAFWVCHQATHTGKLANLLHVTTSVVVSQTEMTCLRRSSSLMRPISYSSSMLAT